jgi:hypothetical protein
VNNSSNPGPILGEPIAIVAFLNHTWSEKCSSTAGYSWQDNDNTEGQAASAFRIGQYALANRSISRCRT